MFCSDNSLITAAVFLRHLPARRQATELTSALFTATFHPRLHRHRHHLFDTLSPLTRERARAPPTADATATAPLPHRRSFKQHRIVSLDRNISIPINCLHRFAFRRFWSRTTVTFLCHLPYPFSKRLLCVK